MTHQYVFDYHDGDIYWCTADVGWVTGHSYIVYGPLANGATTLMFEGVPNYPDASALLAGGRQAPGQHLLHRAHRHPRPDARGRGAGEEDLAQVACACWARSASRSIPRPGSGTTAWSATSRCPIVDTWWQTETGGILITPLPGATALKPGSATKPFFGVKPVIVDAEGKVLRGRGRAAISASTDSLARPDAHGLRRPRALHRDLLHDLSRQVLHRRRRRRDEDGYYWITGRVDDVINVSGHRMGTAEVESALVGHTKVAEAAVVGYPARHQGPGHLRLCHAEGRRASRPTSCARSWSPGCARRSARSPRPTSSSGRPACPRPAPARSCAASCARSPRTTSATSATPRPSPIPAVVDDLVKNRGK